MRRVREIEARIVRLSITRVNAAHPPGVSCAACGRVGAVFGDPRERPLCGNCWRAELRRAEELRTLRRELAALSEAADG